MNAKKYVVWFTEVDKGDIAQVGGKGANLGEMTKAGFPVPPGFIVTSSAYYHFLDESGIRGKIEDALTHLDVNNNKNLEKAAESVQTLIKRTSIPKDISQEIIKAYFKMDKGLLRHAFVAVRSSATAEDLPNASFAGQQETYLNVSGEANVIERVRDCWASLFTPRAIFYRATNKFSHFKVGIAVPVQRMIESDTSGVLFSIDPVTNSKETIVIEAIFGLGEFIVQGKVTPDHYEVNKKSMEITRSSVSCQEKMLVRKGRENRIVTLSKKQGEKKKLTDAQIVALAQLGAKLEKHYYFPQDAEWAVEKNRVYILQTRPVTTTKTSTNTEDVFVTRKLIAKGDPASPGLASGPVKILLTTKEIEKLISGDILVAPFTNPDYVPAMKRASAIVTERGGRTSHAAIVSRELGIPAVVGVKDITHTLKDKVIVTVNGSTGEVFQGGLTSLDRKHIATSEGPQKKLETATKVYVNLAEVERAEKIAHMHVDGVGLLRAEFMIADIGVHPKKLLKDHKRHIFVNALSTKLSEFCKAFHPRPVIYRATDFKTNEYRNLKGGHAFEPEEPNPMLGFRGAARYIADPEVFNMELDAVKAVRNKMNFKNLHLMIPFVRSPEELLKVKQIISASGMTRSSTFKLFLMVEIPTNVIRIDEFLDVGIDGISIGSNDLTMLMLGTDRDNSEVAHDFNEMDPTVLWALEHAVKACAKRSVLSSICGQAPSDSPDLVEKLVSWGISSISVNPDAIYRVRETIFHAEHRIATKQK